VNETKLIKLLSTLDKEELKAFLRFLRSPYHNSNKQAVRLLESLADYHPQFDHQRLTKQRIFQKIHPKGRPYHEGRMNLIMTQLVKQLEQFFAFQEIKKNNFQLSKFRLKAFRSRKLDSAFFREADKIKTSLSKWRKDAKYQLEMFQLNRELFYHPATPRYQPGMESLEACLNHLDMTYLWEKLRWTGLALNRMRVFRETYEHKLLKDVSSEFAQTIKACPLMDFYQKVIEVQQTEDEVLLNELTTKLEQVFPLLKREEQQIFLAILINLAAQKFRAGKTALAKIIFQLNKQGLMHELFVEEGQMPDVNFTNIASIGSISFEFEWTEVFIENYQALLEESVYQNAISLSLAYINFYKGIFYKNDDFFSRTIDHLQSIDHKQPNYSYRARSLLLRAYYEVYIKHGKNHDFVLDFTTSFERFLSRDKKMNPRKAQSFLHFIRLSRQLIRWQTEAKPSKATLNKIKTAIQNTENLFGRNWLLEKVSESEKTI